MIRSRLRTLLLALALGVTAPVFAHEGHDHGEEPVLPATYEPRFEARAGEVELVGIVKGEELWLFVNRYSDNTPWSGLKIEVEQGDKSIAAKADGAGIYRLAAGSLAEPGKHAVVLTVQGEGMDELLTGDLSVPETEAAASDFAIPRWGWAGGAVVIAGLVFWGLRRRR